MRSQSNYWVRQLNSSRLSRRRFIGAAGAAGAGAAGFALVGCGDDDDDDTGASPTAATGSSPTTAPTTGGGADPTATPDSSSGNGITPGGVARFSSANNTWDTFDVDRSRFTPIAGIVGLTNEAIVHYRSWANAELEGAFSESWEQPDETTITFTLREGSTWHDKPPVNGRATTVEDMASFIERNRLGVTADGVEDPNFYRKTEYSTVNTVEVVDASTLRVTFTQINPFFLALLAGSYAKVAAPEAIEAFESNYVDLSGDHVIGTGPFILTEFDPVGEYTLVRNDAFRSPSNWDGVKGVPLFTDNAAQQAAWEQKQLDAFSPTANSVLDDLLNRYSGQIYNTPQLAANPQAGTYFGGTPPWNDLNLTGALFRAVDRHAYLAQIIEGRGAVAGNIVPAQSAFTIAERELITFPGYLPPEQRGEDIADARALWAAGDGASLGPITVDIPDIYEGAYSGFSAFITTMLNETLQTDQFSAAIEPYATISSKVSAGSSGAAAYGNGANNIWYGWISDVQKLDPSSDMRRLYNSTEVQSQQFGVFSDEVDRLTDLVVAELDVEVRKTLCQDIVRELIGNLNSAGIPHTLLQFSNVLRWNYYHIGETPAFINAHNRYRDEWFDSNDPTFQGRPA